MRGVKSVKEICKVDLCGRKHLALGYCSAHYQRHLKGAPMDTPINNKRLSNVDKDRAVMMWMMGKDTYAIANFLAVPESFIYNRLPSWAGRAHAGENPRWKCA